jgi:hypothetical protein
MTMTHLYGTAMPPTEYQEAHDRPRSVIGMLTTSVAGNVVLKVGREVERDGNWELSEHVVLEPMEAAQFAMEVLQLSGAVAPTTSESPLTAQELRVAAAACNGAAGIRRAIGSIGMTGPNPNPDQEAATLESVAAKLAQLAQTLDVNR